MKKILINNAICKSVSEPANKSSRFVTFIDEAGNERTGECRPDYLCWNYASNLKYYLGIHNGEFKVESLTYHVTRSGNTLIDCLWFNL